MIFVHTLLSNGYTLFLPIFLWNIVLARHLPPPYEIKAFNSGIPPFITIGERIGRILIFGLPLFVHLDFGGTTGKSGLIIYTIGTAIYFLSWILLIISPQSRWSKSLIGFTAPAHTIIIWLAGFILTAQSFYFGIPFSRRYLIIAAVIMAVFHVSHAVYVWHRTFR